MGSNDEFYKGNILLVANFPSNVGYAWWLMENFWLEISEYAQQKDVTCYLMYPKIIELPESIKSSQITVIEHDFLRNNIFDLFKSFRLIYKYKIKYLYLTDRPYFSLKYLLLKLLGVKIINHDHMPGERTTNTYFKDKLKKTIHKMQIFSCDHYVGVSEFVKNRAINIACVPPEKISFVHNGIPIFDNKKTDYLLRNFDFPNNSRVVVTTGRATLYKGIDVLIKAADIILNSYKIQNVTFLHIGSGPDLEEFQQLVKDYNIGNNFKFAGFRTDIKQILPCCDIGVQMSLGEAFSLSILEYLCAGLVTIAPDNCGNSEAIQNGVNGLLFKPGDAQDLADKICKALDDKQLSDSLRAEARKTVLSRFSLEQCNREFIKLIKVHFEYPHN